MPIDPNAPPPAPHPTRNGPQRFVLGCIIVAILFIGAMLFNTEAETTPAEPASVLSE